MNENEFSRPVRLDSLGAGERTVAITAEPAERDALARRFGLVAIDRLEAETHLSRDGAIVRLRGTLTAEVTQSCVATGESLPAALSDAFTLRFLPAEQAPADGAEEIGLTEEDCDTLFYEGGAVDIGEAVAETMILALDPFPRSPDADAVLRAAGVLQEGETGPFAALKALKRPPKDEG